MDAGATQSIELQMSDPGELTGLERWLDLVSGIEVARVAGRPGSGEQGALDVLAVLAGSSSLVAAMRVLPEFLRARRSNLSITVSVNGKQVQMEATNVDEVMPILERLLDD